MRAPTICYSIDGSIVLDAAEYNVTIVFDVTAKDFAIDFIYMLPV